MKNLLGTIIAQHMRFETLSISLAVPYKTIRRNHQSPSQVVLKMETLSVNYVSFHLELNAAHMRYIEVNGWRNW